MIFSSRTTGTNNLDYSVAGSNSERNGRLFVVATPIGNLDDLTLRALDVLSRVDIIACEDTRQTRKLLRKYHLQKKLVSYFQPRERQRIPLILDKLLGGEDVALVSDAGTPGLSDPGFPLIRAALEKGIRIVPVPGVSAVTAALSAAGLPTHRFLFLGFPPAKRTAARKLLQTLDAETSTLVFYVPSRKLLTFLDLAMETLGDREAVVAREMTKIFEEFLRGTLSDLIRILQDKTVKGETTVLIKGLDRKTRRIEKN